MAEERKKTERRYKSAKTTGGRRGQPRPKVQNPGLLFKRIMSYVFKYYKFHFIGVLVCIVAAVLANVRGTMFTRTLIDAYIMPMMGQANPDFSPLAGAIGSVAVFYAIGIIASFTQQKLMIYVGVCEE